MHLVIDPAAKNTQLILYFDPLFTETHYADGQVIFSFWNNGI